MQVLLLLYFSDTDGRLLLIQGVHMNFTCSLAKPATIQETLQEVETDQVYRTHRGESRHMFACLRLKVCSLFEWRCQMCDNQPITSSGVCVYPGVMIFANERVVEVHLSQWCWTLVTTTFGKNLRCGLDLGWTDFRRPLGCRFSQVRLGTVGGNDKDKLTPHRTECMKCFSVASCPLIPLRPVLFLV